LIYGEVFLNMERNSARTYEISRLLYENYQKITKTSEDSLFRLQINVQKWETKFEIHCQEIWLKTSTKPNDNKIIALADLRKKFLQNYTNTVRNKQQQFLLFTFWKEIDDNEYWETYNFWLFNQGNELEFEQWLEKNAPSFGRFVTWFVQHPLEIGTKKLLRK